MSIQRRVQLIESSEEMPTDATPRPFSQYLDVPNIILLGDPGSGKTHTFEAASEKENAKFISVRNFYASDGIGCENQTIYLDGLDEFRSRIADKNTVLEIIRLLNHFKPKKLRLSCRAADWLGQTDLSSFKYYFNDTPYVVLRLEALSEEEITAILREQGLKNPEEFIDKAKRLVLDSLITNPQTLIMLYSVIKQNLWPRTKTELFNLSIINLLSEHNPEHTVGQDLGLYTPAELIEVAGATCASILISNVDGISLNGNSEDENFPSYRDIAVSATDKVEACLTRRAFKQIDWNCGGYSYIHRMIAEFLAAKWLTKKILGGLPLSRVISLICVKGHPTTELRGLYAWLTTLLSESSSILIPKDPLGILMYGDPASLSPSYRRVLLDNLEKLSIENPWFHNNALSNEALGALSVPDMVEPFQRILSNPDSGSELRSLILDAISNGTPVTGLTDILNNIIRDPNGSWYLQSKAVDALLRVNPDSNEIIKGIYRSTLATNPSTARLRAEILRRIYDDGFAPHDVYSVLEDVLQDTKAIDTGSLWFLVDALPLDALPDILDLLYDLQSDEEMHENTKNDHEVEAVFSRLLVRVLKSNKTKTPERLWQWLSGLHRFSHGVGGFLNTTISAWLIDNQQTVLGCFEIALKRRDITDPPFYFLNNFEEITLMSLSHLNMARYILEVLKAADESTDKQIALYTMLASLIFNEGPAFRIIFEEFFEFADGHTELIDIRNKYCLDEIPEFRIKAHHQKLERELIQEREKQQNITNLLQAKDSIRSGSHLHYIGWLASLYLRPIGNQDRELSLIERLRATVGDELILAALEGFSNVLKKSDLPRPTEIARLNAKHGSFWWWYALVAGMNEEWRKEGNLNAFSDVSLQAAFSTATVLLLNTSDCQWTNQMYLERPNIVKGIFEDIARVELELKKDNISVLYTLASNEHTKSWRGKLALSLLEDFPSAKANSLRCLLQAALSAPESHDNLIKLTETTIKAMGRVKKEQRALWLATGYLLSPQTFNTRLTNYSRKNESVFWDTKDLMAYTCSSNKDEKSSSAISRLENVIKLFGEKFPNVDLPIGGGFVGQNPWDAAEFVKRKINALSTKPDKESSDALRRLLDNNALSSYHDHLKYANANQAVLRREAEFEQPSWSKTIETLKGGKPADISDLFALTLDHLETLKEEIRHSNTDIYKSFWNCNSKGAVISQEIETTCTDRLIDLLKPHLAPLEIDVEPAGHMAADKEADIIITSGGDQKLPIELKRDTHPDIWTACMNQLERLYTRDPESKGYGIYGVFWFGEKRKGSIRKPPNGIKRPQSAKDLEKALQSLIPRDKKHCLEAVVFDVTPPALTQKETMRKKS